MKCKAIPLVCLSLIVASSVWSQERANGWYLSAGGGFDEHRGTGIMNNIGSEHIDWKTGWNAGAAFGYMINQFRAEFELMYHRSKLSKIHTTDVGNAEDAIVFPGGHIRDLTYMFNLLLDVPLFSGFGAYVGGGIGGSRNQYTIHGYQAFATAPASFPEWNKTNHLFAAQFLAGITYWVSENIMLSLGYRLLRTKQLSCDPNDASPLGGGGEMIVEDVMDVDVVRGCFDKKPIIHSGELTVSYFF